MSDHTDPGHGFGRLSHAARSSKAEYFLYFTAIFLVALPFAVLPHPPDQIRGHPA